MNFFINHPRSGKPDTMLTLAIYSTMAVLLKFLLNGVKLELLGIPFDFGTVDAGLIAALLTPTLGAYIVRKHKDSPDNPKTQNKQEEGK